MIAFVVFDPFNVFLTCLVAGTTLAVVVPIVTGLVNYVKGKFQK